MRGCFHTHAPHSSCSLVLEPLVALLKFVVNDCFTTRQPLSLSSVQVVALPPPLQNGAAHAGTYGTIARSIGRQVLPQDQARDPRELGCAKQLPNHLGTSKTPGRLAPCGPTSLLPTCRPLGAAPCSSGLWLLFFLRRHLATAATSLATLSLGREKCAKLRNPRGVVLALSLAHAKTLLWISSWTTRCTFLPLLALPSLLLFVIRATMPPIVAAPRCSITRLPPVPCLAHV